MPEDWIRVRQIRAYGYHGVFPVERLLGQIFEADVELRTDLTCAMQSDNLVDTIDYVDVHHGVKKILTGPPHLLIESLAAQIAEMLFQAYPVTHVIIRIRKPDLKGSVGMVEVELQRERPGKQQGVKEP